MKKITLLFLGLILSPVVLAETITLSFSEIPVIKFAEATYKNILKKDYVLTPAILDSGEKITLSVTTEKENLLTLLKEVLLSSGISVEERNEVFWLDKTFRTAEQSQPQSVIKSESIKDVTALVDQNKDKVAQPQEISIYQMQYRKGQELQKIAETLVKVTVLDDCLILQGEPYKVQIARTLLAQYDTRRNELLAKVTVVEYTSTNDDGAGLFGALHLLGQKLNLQIGDNGVLGNLVSFKNSTVEAFLSIISQDSRFRVLSTSRLRIASGKSGKFSVGQEVPTLGKADFDKEGNPVQSVFYREAGLILDLSPQIVNDYVYTDIKHEVSDFSITKTSNIDSPTISKRSFSSSFTADFGEVIFLGGLEEQKGNEANSGLFGFRLSRNVTSSRTVLFLVLEYERV
jgi:type II secretory pathway component GspD/PulD (secretin)